MSVNHRVAMAARWLKVARGYSQIIARRRNLIAAMVEARRAQNDQTDDAAGVPWEEGDGDEEPL